jgi:AcrR family transcriptional regulator
MDTEIKPQEDTKQRLLEAAEALFADKGYAAVSVREITNAAGTHLSAINYHFGDKRSLYLEVFRRMVVPRGQVILDGVRQALDGIDASPDQVLRAAAHAFLSLKVNNEKNWMRHHQLMARELAHPTEALDMMIQEVHYPLFKMLSQRLSPYLSPEALSRLPMYMMSFSGQIMQFSLGRHLIESLTGKPYDDDFLEFLVNHIVDFSLKGMELDGKEAR